MNLAHENQRLLNEGRGYATTLYDIAWKLKSWGVTFDARKTEKESFESVTISTEKNADGSLPTITNTAVYGIESKDIIEFREALRTIESLPEYQNFIATVAKVRICN